MKKKIRLNNYKNEIDSRRSNRTAFMQKKTKKLYLHSCPTFCFKLYKNMIGKNIADGLLLHEICFLSPAPFIL